MSISGGESEVEDDVDDVLDFGANAVGDTETATGLESDGTPMNLLGSTGEDQGFDNCVSAPEVEEETKEPAVHEDVIMVKHLLDEEDDVDDIEEDDDEGAITTAKVGNESEHQAAESST